jgi:hypothetical protein
MLEMRSFFNEMRRRGGSKGDARNFRNGIQVTNTGSRSEDADSNDNLRYYFVKEQGCNFCHQFDAEKLEHKTEDLDLPTLGQVKAASRGGCPSCKIVENAVLKFGLVENVLGSDREKPAGSRRDAWAYTDDEGVRRSYVDVAALLVRIRPEFAKDRNEYPPRLLVSVYGNKGYETEPVWVYTTSGEV